jgi:hypothetical protein
MTATCVTSIAILYFSVCATHDYFDWNRARWTTLRELTQVWKLSPSKIDGGYEFNGSHTFPGSPSREGGKSFWWVQDDEYVVTFRSLLPGYRVIKEYHYTRWLPSPHQEAILVQQRTPLTPGRDD